MFGSRELSFGSRELNSMSRQPRFRSKINLLYFDMSTGLHFTTRVGPGPANARERSHGTTRDRTTRHPTRPDPWRHNLGLGRGRIPEPSKREYQRFGAIDVTKQYKCIWFGDMDGAKP